MDPSCLRTASALGGTCLDQVALDVCQTPKHCNHQSPSAGGGVGPRLRQGAELPTCIHDALDDSEEVKGRASEAVDVRHGHDVAGGHGFQHPLQLAPVGLRATCLFAIDLGASLHAELVELRVERLAVGVLTRAYPRRRISGSFSVISFANANPLAALTP